MSFECQDTPAPIFPAASPMNSPHVVPAAALPVLVLRGSPALSAFRIDKLRQSLLRAHPSIRSIESTFMHFVHTTRAQTATGEQQIANHSVGHLPTKSRNSAD